MLSSAKISSHCLYKQRNMAFNNLNFKYVVLSEAENNDMQKKLSQIDQSELSNLWHKFMIESDQIYLRKFLDINKNWDILLDITILTRLMNFTANKFLFNLWCKLIESSQLLQQEILLSKLDEFEQFVQILSDNSISNCNILPLQQLTSKQFVGFLQILDVSGNKLMQIKYAYPPITNVSAGLALLSAGYSFVSKQIINLTQKMDPGIIDDSTKLLNYLVLANDCQLIHDLSLLYLIKYNNDKIEFFIQVSEFLKKCFNDNKISKEVYLIIIKLCVALINALTSDSIMRIAHKSVYFYSIFKNKLFNLIDLEQINKDKVTVVEDVYSLIEYLVKIKLTIDLDNYADIDDLNIGLQKIRLQHIKSMSQSRNLDLVLSDFKGGNPNVKFPLSDAELALIKEQFILIEQFETQFIDLSLLKLADLVEDIKRQLNYTNSNLSGELKQELICKLMAIAMRAFVQYFNIYPYDVQRLCVLAMLLPRVDVKGVLAQVKTGEGKSTIVTLLTLILACEGKAIDIITSTEYLSLRDEQKYKAFFGFFDITTSNVCDQNINKEHFCGQVIYGTNYNFEFSILFDKLYLLGNRVHFANASLSRPLQVAIVDEVDNMLVDKALNSARIAYPSEQNHVALYILIYDYIKASCINKKPDTEVKQQCAVFAAKYNISEIELDQLIDNAYKACFEYELNIDYCINKSLNNSHNSSLNIVIIDKDTGRLSEGSRWQHGLHQFLEYKHDLEIKEDSMTLGALSHPAFFSYYSEIYGVTGTIGTKIERQEIKEVYSLASFDVPTYRPTLRQQLESVVCQDENQFTQLLLQEVNTTLVNGRPTLVLCASIKSSMTIYNLLRTYMASLSIQLLNDMQHQDEEFIICKAGCESQITVATNAAGRGTDIAIKKDALKNGGLHVIFTFFPSNERVEAQGAGRAGRQGNPGSYRILIPHDDELLVQLKKRTNILEKILSDLNLVMRGDIMGDDPQNLLLSPGLNELYSYREQMLIENSKARRIHSAINLIQHKILERFCEYYKVNSGLPDFNRHEVLSKWANFYTNLENILPPQHNDQIDSFPGSELVEYERTLDELFAIYSRV